MELRRRRTPDDRDPRDATERCAKRILETVPRVMHLLRDEMRQEVGEGLSVPQFRVLAFLGRTPGASLSAAAAFMGITPPTASVMVNRLVERKLVARAADPEERRLVRLSLTPRGATALERSRAHARARVAERLAGLARGELETISTALALLDGALGVSSSSHEENDDAR